MTENETLCAMFADGLIEREDVPPECWHKRRKHKPRPPSWKEAVKQAKAKGMDLTVVGPDGSSMTFKNVGGDNITTDGAEQNTDHHQGSELDQWLAKRHAH